MKIWSFLEPSNYREQNGLVFPSYLEEPELSTWSRTDIILSISVAKTSRNGPEAKRLSIRSLKILKGK
jgi:hypothetical protein